MPDFDKIHDGPGPYQKPCKQLLDGIPVELVADNLLRSIISTLKYYGDDSVIVLLEISNHLKQLPAGQLFNNTIDWAAQSKRIREKSQGKSCKTSTTRTSSIVLPRSKTG